jgi:hypothetical protein
MLTSFPLMVEQISKRLGQQYIMFGTSMVYFLAQALAASLVQVLGFIMKNKTRTSSFFGILMAITVIFVSFCSSILAEAKYTSPFEAVVIE